MNKYMHILKNGLIYSYCTGFTYGLMIPNNINISIYKNKKIHLHPPFFPLFGGLISSIGFLCSPLLLINYMANGTYFDKLYDNIIDKNHIKITRYHQYDGNNDKYGFPSHIHIKIVSKSYDINDSTID